MTMTDPIADMLTRIRNANVAMHDDGAHAVSSKLKEALADDPPARRATSRASTSPTTPTAPAETLTIQHEVLARARPRRSPASAGCPSPACASTPSADKVPACPRRPRRRRPVHQPGAHDRPRGAQAPRRRRGPLLRLVGGDRCPHRTSRPSPSRPASRSPSTAAHVTVKGPKGTLSRDVARADHRAPGRRARCSSSGPTTSARTGRSTASPARSSTTWSSASPTASPRSSRSSASATGPRARAPTARARPRLQPPRQRRGARRHHLRGAGPDPHRRRGHRQGAGRPGGRQHPQDPQARALQGQGRPLRRRARRQRKAGKAGK